MERNGSGRQAVTRPMGQAPADDASGHRLRDWTELKRTTALESLRYTRFVTFMKRALPIAAGALLASVVAYSVIPRPQERMTLGSKQMGNIRNDLAMIKPWLSGSDAKGNRFVITASAAIQDPKQRHHATLLDVQADIQFDNQKWLMATAKRGLFDIDAGTLKLGGGISLYTDSGYELHTSSADVDLKKNLFQGQEKVTGQGPMGSLSADRFVFDRAKQQVRMSGHVHMVMYPKKAGLK